MPSATTDVNPDDVSIAPAVVFNSGVLGTSNTVTISGIMQTISVSISGGSGAEIVKNGTPTGLTTSFRIKPMTRWPSVWMHQPY